jgi:serine/threonine-protein kinase RsbW/stage II sporulation protein AB (anti-sigma F factor)
VPGLRKEAVAYAREQRVEEPPIGDLKLALAEAINNTVVHAFRDRQPGSVTVSISIEPEANQVKVLVTDDGIGCCPIRTALDSAWGCR